METIYNHKQVEEKLYEMWEKGGYFQPKIDKKKKPFTIILPLPNANDPMHMGHALFTVQDILIRYHRMKGDPTLWLPGADHAGIETQFVFEKRLAKEDKSRFDYDRDTFYKMIWEYVEKNRIINMHQMKKLGFSLDWTRYHYSLEPDIVAKVMQTFRKLHKDNLVYRAERLVNYCTKCGTSFSDLEVKYVDRVDPLYFIKYGPFTIATVRPETKFRDTALAVNPKDKRYKKYIGQTLQIPGLLGDISMTVISDEEVDPKFGTGIMKVTPAHDPHDFELGKKFHLPVQPIITFQGRMDFSWFLAQKNIDPTYKARAEKYNGKKVAEMRRLMLEDFKEDGLLVKVDEKYTHRIGTCYRCGSVIEPLPLPQWYVAATKLAGPAIAAIKTGKTKIVPKKRFEKMYFDWLNNIYDWNISRQITWGPRIPVWYCLSCNPTIQITFLSSQKEKVNGTYESLREKYSFDEIQKGLQSLIAPKDAAYQLSEGDCVACARKEVLQETDTFDTWFLSGQWPMTTLGVNVDDPKKSSEDFQYFYPTSVLDTMWDILFFWVARMMMLGLYVTKEVPFTTVHLHARVVDKHGVKMSKSKGNVIDPLLSVEQYGADALRMALILGVGPGSDIALSDEKIKGMRNFSNKLWNMGRFLLLMKENYGKEVPVFAKNLSFKTEDKAILKQLETLTKKTTKGLNTFRFGAVSEDLYQFVWHELADKYIESVKNREDKDVALSVLEKVFIDCIKLLHPFMPFVTEEIYQQLTKSNTSLMISSWPEA
ncbi:MAG: valine--tRNA ligase [Candidatus Levyibacteriota bacterium]